MADETFLENIFCKRIMQQRDDADISADDNALKYNQEQVKRINLERELNSAIAAAGMKQSDAVTKIAQLEKEKSYLTEKYADAINSMVQLRKDANSLFEHTREFWLCSQNLQQQLVAYENKYQKLLVQYPARFVGKQQNIILMDVKSFMDAGKNDWAMQAWAQEHNCRVQDVQKDYPAKTYEQCAEIAAVRVQARLPVPYGSDDALWGITEFWEYATEVFYGTTQKRLSFDCDSWAACKHVIRRICGVPDEMMRFVTGTTFGNEGHATNAVFMPSLGYFAHLNSTSRCSDNDDILQFKKMGDSSERINIAQHWWSSTARFSHFEMLTQAQAREFEKSRKSRRQDRKLARKAVITPLYKVVE